jgi:hypothetical protein
LTIVIMTLVCIIGRTGSKLRGAQPFSLRKRGPPLPFAQSLIKSKIHKKNKKIEKNNDVSKTALNEWFEQFYAFFCILSLTTKNIYHLYEKRTPYPFAEK